ncbi:unnamed protein product [Ranitomeya imitator]|uniref:Uncharacterized protein n=1 Tax=Ranitomeya imitator TaxID=111125 RepID=A0ABN9LQS2_9NEOB|nr:unnamed protein product [Ranitomeya imitator]
MDGIPMPNMRSVSELLEGCSSSVALASTKELESCKIHRSKPGRKGWMCINVILVQYSRDVYIPGSVDQEQLRSVRSSSSTGGLTSASILLIH